MHNYIVSLTTIPSKFHTLHLTIESIVNQTLSPSKIIVNIPNKYDFRFDRSEIDPEDQRKLLGRFPDTVTINNIDEDYGPGTKILGFLNSQFYSASNSNTFLVLIDDDLFYDENMLKCFDDYSQHHSIDSGSFYVYDYDIKIGQGADAFFIRLNRLDQFIEFYNVVKEQDYIAYHDDFYISFYLFLKGIELYHLTPPNKESIYKLLDSSDVDALRNLTGKYNRLNLNKKCSSILRNMNNEGFFEFLK